MAVSRAVQARGCTLLRGGGCVGRHRKQATLRRVPATAMAKHRPEIAEARRLPGASRGEIIPRHRNGEIGPKTQFLAVGVGGEVKALADVLAGEIEERLGLLQNAGLGPDIAGLRKRQ